MSSPAPGRRRIEEVLIRRAQEDNAFRERLKADPKGVVKAEFGVQLPEPFTITVVEETDAALYLVLPAPAIPQKDRELADDELDAIAGGIITGGNMEKAKEPSLKLSPETIRPTTGF